MWRNMTRRHSRARKHILFWSIPVLTTGLLLFTIWFGGDYVLGKARPFLEKVLSIVEIYE